MTKTFPAYQDPGHGWAKVPRSLLEELGIAEKISAYSYQRGDQVFLEEDCDLSLFVEAMNARGIELSFVSSHSNRTSKIRNYESYVFMTDAAKLELSQLKCRMLNHTNWNEKAKVRIINSGLGTLRFWQKQYGF